MKTFITILALFGSITSASDTENPDEPPGSPAATAALQRALDSMPNRPLTVSGSLKTRRPRGFVHDEMLFEMHLDFSRVPFRATYKIFDTDGNRLHTLNLSRNGAPEIEFDPRDPSGGSTAAPPLSARIGASDITWLDLTLDVLWWNAVRIEGHERMRGRDCDIVLVQPPRPIAGYSGARLWIDRQIGIFLRAEHLDEQGETFRRMWIRSVRKIDDRWFVKDLEVDSVNSGTRTRLRVEDVTVEP